MTWEWSHSHEAYRDAELNLRDLPHETLVVIAAEWFSRIDTDEETGFDEEAYPKHVKTLDSLTDETLADMIWQRASDQASCTNGGHYAYLCPFGCGCHMVAFDRDEQEADNA